MSATGNSWRSAALLIERPSVLILDEPNSALNERETQRLFTILRELSADGVTIIYVSHRLEEVFDIADRITVMRNGAIVTTVDRHATTIGRVVEAMVGTSPAELFPPRAAARHRRLDPPASSSMASPSTPSCATSRSRRIRGRSSAWQASRAPA